MNTDRVPGDIVFNHGAFVHYLSGSGPAKPQDPDRVNNSLRKLAGFSETYFIELSADMYDELQRRLDPELFAKGPLRPFPHIHWKRNDARRQVGTLPEYRFREICRDIVTEQERRYPELKTGVTYPLRDSLPMDVLRKSQEQAAKRSSQNMSNPMSIVGSDRETMHDRDSSNSAFRMQNVSQTNVNPKITEVIESDSDSDSDDDHDTSTMASNDPSVLRGDHLPFTPIHSSSTFDRHNQVAPELESQNSVLPDQSSVWSKVENDVDDVSRLEENDNDLESDPVINEKNKDILTPSRKEVPVRQKGVKEFTDTDENVYDVPRNEDPNNDKPLNGEEHTVKTPATTTSTERLSAVELPTSEEPHTTKQPNNNTVKPLPEIPLPSSHRDLPENIFENDFTDQKNVNTLTRDPSIVNENSEADVSTHNFMDTNKGAIPTLDPKTQEDSLETPTEMTLDVSNNNVLRPQARPGTARSVARSVTSAGSAWSTDSKANINDTSDEVQTLKNEINRLLVRISELESQDTSEEYESLKSIIKEQKKVTEQVREEAAKSLVEMRTLAANREEQVARANNLEAEVAHWKSLYKTVMHELTRTRDQFLNSEIQQADLAKDLPVEMIDRTEGKVDEKDLYDCLHSVHNLVACVHSSNTEESDTLTMLHQVILTARKIYVKDDPDIIIPTAANQLITIVKNFTISGGLLPTILVDSACADLGNAVIQYSKEKKVKPNSMRDFERGSITPRASDISFLDSADETSSPIKHLEKDKRALYESTRNSAMSDTISLPSTTGDQSHSRPLPTISPPPVPKDEPDVESPTNYKKDVETLDNEKTSATNSQSGSVTSVSLSAKDGADNTADTIVVEKDAVNNDSRGSTNVEAPERKSSLSVSNTQPITDVYAETDSQRDSGNSFNYNPIPRKKGLFRPKQGPEPPLDMSIQALQQFLEDQTSDTVDAISALLKSIKGNATTGEMKPIISKISIHVQRIIDATAKAMTETRNKILREKGKYIVENLQNCLERLEMLLDEELEAVHDNAKPNRHLKQRLAGVNFDMAKSTKELVKAVEEVLLQEEVAVIDRNLD